MSEKSGTGQGAKISHLPSRTGLLPQIRIDIASLRHVAGDHISGQLITASGQVDVAIRSGHLYCTADQETLLKNGVVMQEWLPGQPGTGRFVHAVMLIDPVDLKLGKKSPPLHRVLISASGLYPPTIEVRLPLTPTLSQQLSTWDPSFNA